MINFRVFRLCDVIKKLVKIGILIIGIIIFASFFKFFKTFDLNSAIDNKKNEIKGKTLLECLDENFNDNYKEKIDEQNLIAKELDFVKSVFSENITKNSIYLEDENTEDVILEDTNDVQETPITQVVAEHNKEDIYNITYSNVQIRNQTSHQLTEEMLTPDVQIDKSNIVIFHTHTSESYTPTEKYMYQASGNFRTLDANCNVIGVGNELTNRLMNKKINVIHDTTVHDHPEYNGSYTRSMQTVQTILQNNKADLVIDLHRDALADSTYGPSVMIGNEKAAQIMFVMGSDEGGLDHPNWNQNLKIAIKIQQKANEMYPGLFKPILLTKYRYNQHLAKGSCILEIGATGNTMEECLVSMKYLAEVIANVE